jgi:hypothetical protein
MDRECNMDGRDENAYKILIAKSDGERSLRRPRVNEKLMNVSVCYSYYYSC